MFFSDSHRFEQRGVERRLRASSGRLLAATVMAMLLAIVAFAGPGTTATSRAPASPEASPVATPAASPIAHATSASTQIIVGSITIEIYDDAMEPQHFESAVGRDVTITVVNRGTKPHNLTIDAFDIDIDLAPGESHTVEITGPALGNYRYYSDLPGDKGIEGVMTVFI